MRIVIPVLIIILGFALVVSATSKVTITLTTDQVNLVNAAGAGGASIALTAAQVTAIKKTFPGLKKNSVLVAPSALSSKKQVCIACDANGNPTATAP